MVHKYSPLAEQQFSLVSELAAAGDILQHIITDQNFEKYKKILTTFDLFATF